jgi:hypothetical protein
MISCSLVNRGQLFGGSCCFHFDYRSGEQVPPTRCLLSYPEKNSSLHKHRRKNITNIRSLLLSHFPPLGPILNDLGTALDFTSWFKQEHQYYGRKLSWNSVWASCHWMSPLPTISNRPSRHDTYLGIGTTLPLSSRLHIKYRSDILPSLSSSLFCSWRWYYTRVQFFSLLLLPL